MMKLALAVLFSPATAATLGPRQAGSGCCFGLTSAGTVNETVEETQVGGELVLGSAFQQGGFCLDKSTRTIQDVLGHNCFMTAPLSQFECLSGLAGATTFQISSPSGDGHSYLQYNDGSGTYYACPVEDGGDRYYDIFSMEKTNTTGCVKVALALHNPSDACSTYNGTASTGTVVSRTSSLVQRTSQAPAQGTAPSTTTVLGALNASHTPAADVPSSIRTSTVNHGRATSSSASTATPTTSSPTCSVPSSAPSIAPYRVGTPDASAPDGVRDTSAEAAVSPQNTTVLQYAIPGAFLPPAMTDAASASEPPLCALQFRMPVCTALPAGYPCYQFSGLEQEVLADSGMALNLTLDTGGHDASSSSWDGSALHQVFPGDRKVLGTFACGGGSGPDAPREMTWHVSSVRNFSLEFLHAGVGANPEFRDGIGAWIVPCQ
ncbi:hypothetical protein GGR56DRAFT_579801 [Xylariaceae sp. FL0804]|nr:hypothetical protein GGR56DRAFT_579801 [Xylariaceae sp. FL0804]